jgi:hypothetical protein
MASSKPFQPQSSSCHFLFTAVQPPIISTTLLFEIKAWEIYVTGIIFILFNKTIKLCYVMLYLQIKYIIMTEGKFTLGFFNKNFHINV